MHSGRTAFSSWPQTSLGTSCGSISRSCRKVMVWGQSEEEAVWGCCSSGRGSIPKGGTSMPWVSYRGVSGLQRHLRLAWSRYAVNVRVFFFHDLEVQILIFGKIALPKFLGMQNSDPSPYLRRKGCSSSVSSQPLKQIVVFCFFWFFLGHLNTYSLDPRQCDTCPPPQESLASQS